MAACMVKIGKRKVLQRCGVKLEPKMFTECKRSCVMPTHAQTQRKKYCGHRGRVCTCTCTCILKCLQVQQAKHASMHICACMYACIHAHARAYPNACKYNSGRKRNLDRGLGGIQRPQRRISSTVCAASSCSTHSEKAKPNEAVYLELASTEPSFLPSNWLSFAQRFVSWFVMACSSCFLSRNTLCSSFMS